MKYIITFLIIIYCDNIFSQEQQTDCATTILINQNARNFMVYKYPIETKALKLNDFSEVSNNTPEELMSSVLSASNLNWYNFNREEKKEKTSQDFNYIEKADSENYYFELLYKVKFNANGKEYTVIKYYLHTKGKAPLGFAEAMKKNNNRWVTTSEAEISQLLFFMIMIDVKYIDAIFNNIKSDNDDLNKIITSNTVNSSVNINGVLNDLEEGLANNDKNLKATLDVNRYFK